MQWLKKWNRELTQLLIAVAAALALLVVNVLRILNVPITIDETGYNPRNTYTDLVTEPLGHANNHILHSLLRKFFVELFNDDLLFLRLDSLLAQLVYLVFSYKIGRLLFGRSWWQTGCFLLLNISSPFLFSFWGLSRGYGLALAFVMTSVYYLLQFIETRREVKLMVCLGAAILAVYSNFSLLNYFIAVPGALVAWQLFFGRQSTAPGRGMRIVSLVVLATAALAALIVVPLNHVYHNGELAFMGSNGFIKDTMVSLVSWGYYLKTPEGNTIITAIIWGSIGITAFSGICWIWKAGRCMWQRQPASLGLQFGLVLFALVISPVVALMLQHALLGINYITDRAALFFMPLFILLFSYSFSHIKRPTWLGAVLFTSVLLLAGFNFVTKTDLESTTLWWFDRDDLKMLKRVTDESKDLNRKIRLRPNPFLGPSLRYDIDKYYPGKFEKLNWDQETYVGRDTTADFYYVAASDVNDSLKKYYHADTEFEAGCYILYRRN